MHRGGRSSISHLDLTESPFYCCSTFSLANLRIPEFNTSDINKILQCPAQIARSTSPKSSMKLSFRENRRVRLDTCYMSADTGPLENV